MASAKTSSAVPLVLVHGDADDRDVGRRAIGREGGTRISLRRSAPLAAGPGGSPAPGSCPAPWRRTSRCLPGGRGPPAGSPARPFNKVISSTVATFLVLAALGWPACARAIYRGATVLRSAEWMIQGHACGLKTRQLIRLHILPHLRPLLLPQFLICVPAFIVAEANLGALGLGVGEPMPSWGAMLLELDNSALLARSLWVYLPIALLAIVLLILEFFTNEVDADA